VTRRSRHGVVALLVALMALLTTGALPALAEQVAAAGGTARISDLSVGDDGVLSLVFGASGLTGTGPDAASVRVLFDDLPVAARASPVRSGDTVRVVVLTMDVSTSMGARLSRGVSRFKAAQQAAEAFLESVPADVRVGLVTFSGDVTVAVEPTTDRAAVRSAVDSLKLADDTRLYDGVTEAVRVSGTEGTRSILLLSDGKNEGSGSLSDATMAITASGVGVDVVRLGDTDNDAVLNTIAQAGNGQVGGAERADQLAAQFKAAADAISSQLAVTVAVPERFLGRGTNVEVQATAGGKAISDSAFYAFDAPAIEDPVAAGPQPVAAPPAVGSWAAVIALAGVALGLGILLTLGALTLTRQYTRRARVARLIGGVREPVPVTSDGAPRERGIGRPAVNFADRLLRSRDLDRTLAVQLAAAGLPLRAGEWMLLHVGIAVAATLLLGLIGGGAIGALVGLALGLILPWSFLTSRVRARHDAFASALPDTLQMVAGSLSAGLTLQQGIESVASEGRAPVSDEMRRALAEGRLGMPLEDALDRVAVRMESPDFAWVVMATRIQREVGGNLPELLELVAGTLRERDRVRRQGRVLSAEGRVSAWVIGALPLAFVAYMLVVRPDYLSPLVTDPFGWALLLGGVVLFLAGVLWLVRLSRLKV